MPRASKDDPQNEALSRGETVEGSVTGMTDAPSTPSGALGGATSAGTGEVAPATEPATEPATAEGPTRIVNNAAYAEAAQQGFWGHTPEPGANDAVLRQASGDNDLRTGRNDAGAVKLGPETLASGEDPNQVVEVLPTEAVVPEDAKEPPPALDPENAEQYGNGPALDR